MAAAASGRLFFPPLRSPLSSKATTLHRPHQLPLFLRCSGSDLILVPAHAHTPRIRATARDAADAATLMVSRAEAGDFEEARSIWAQLLHSSAAACLPSAAPRLLPAYARLVRFDEILLAVRDPAAARALYPLAVSCLGAAGELARMEDAVVEMGRLGVRVHAAAGDAFLRAYAAAGTIPQMEAAYRRHKRTGLRISRAAIRAVASAYIAKQKYFKLGAFARDAGLARRRGAGGRTLLLWNLYLLSFAANFRMKSLQRAFLEMAAAGPHHVQRPRRGLLQDVHVLGPPPQRRPHAPRRRCAGPRHTRMLRRRVHGAPARAELDLRVRPARRQRRARRGHGRHRVRGVRQGRIPRQFRGVAGVGRREAAVDVLHAAGLLPQETTQKEPSLLELLIITSSVQ